MAIDSHEKADYGHHNNNAGPHRPSASSSSSSSSSSQSSVTHHGDPSSSSRKASTAGDTIIGGVEHHEHKQPFDSINHPNNNTNGNNPQNDTTNMKDPAKSRLEASRKLANPLVGMSPEVLGTMGEDYARLAGLADDPENLRAFRLGAMIAGDQDSTARYDRIADLTEEERNVLEREETHKWSNPSMLYWVIIST